MYNGGCLLVDLAQGEEQIRALAALGWVESVGIYSFSAKRTMVFIDAGLKIAAGKGHGKTVLVIKSVMNHEPTEYLIEDIKWAEYILRGTVEQYLAHREVLNKRRQQSDGGTD